MGKDATKAALLEAGGRIFLERGYNHSGVEAVLKAVGVPKGSFYHYFESKEDFGLQVLNRFAERVDAELDRYVNDRAVPPLERLRRFGEAVCARIEARQCRSGCLVGNLSQEMADQSEAFRARLDEIFRGWVDRYAGCLEEARVAGELPEGLDARELAEFWVSGWQGALMRAKTARSTAPIQAFHKLMFGHLLRS